jgi:hypothetical protein
MTANVRSPWFMIQSTHCHSIVAPVSLKCRLPGQCGPDFLGRRAGSSGAQETISRSEATSNVVQTVWFLGAALIQKLLPGDGG